MNKGSLGIIALLAVVGGAIWLVQADDEYWEPPGPPAPTMVSLQQIYDRVSASPVGIAKTGQTGCWDAAGASIACAGTGQDGEHQNGVSVTPRFTDKGNGTVKDNLTGLMWLKNANCFGQRTWTNALSDANTLASGSCGLTDGSVAGDWRLPNVRELHSLIDYGRTEPALPLGHPFSGVQVSSYWSSTTRLMYGTVAWMVGINGGVVIDDFKSADRYVWPVRGGQ